MNIVVAGGGGFIGSHLTESLLSDNHNVIVVDTFCSSQKQNLAAVQESDNLNIIEQDVIEPVQIDTDVDYVLHFASRASPPDYQDNKIHTMRTNAEGTLNLLRLAHQHNASFLFASTSEVYGNPEIHPQVETYNGNVNTTGPRSCYDEGKRYGEALITSFADEYEIDWKIIRIFNTYGPRLRKDDGRVISNFIIQALRNEPITVYGDGSQTRSFCYVDDLVRGIRAVMKYRGQDVFNLGNPDEYTILELAEIIQDVVDTKSEIVFKELPKDDPTRRKPDISKVKKSTDWAPNVSFREGLRKTVSCFQKD